MYRAEQLVNWMIVKNMQEIELSDFYDGLTKVKAMKLLYYLQAANLVKRQQRLFDEEIVAWKFGPVVLSIHQKYEGQRVIVSEATQLTKQELADYQLIENDAATLAIIEPVYDKYSKFSTYDLVQMTQHELPYRKALRNLPLNDFWLTYYFRDKF